MHTEPARHPRAGIAIGVAILVIWLAAVGLSLAADAGPDGPRTATPAAHEQPGADARVPGR